MTQEELHYLVDKIFELKSSLVEQAKDEEYFASAGGDDRVQAIDYCLEKRDEMKGLMSELKTEIYEFWRDDMHEPEDIYQRYFYKLRDNMKFEGGNVYYGNGVWLNPK